MNEGPSARDWDVCMSRRRWLKASAFVAGGCCAGWTHPAANAEEIDLDNLNSRQHACIDMPVIDPILPLSEQFALSTVEQVIAANEHTIESHGLAASAPLYGPGLVTADAPLSAPARAAYQDRWTEKVLRIAFVNGVRQLREDVFDLAREWCKYADLQFDLVDRNSRPHVLVQFNRALGHYSHIGRGSLAEISKGRHSMNLGFVDSPRELDEAYNKFVVLHEFGHALGCVHEHQHPRTGAVLNANDPRVVQYFKNALRTNDMETVRYNVFRRYNEKDLIKFSDYDSKSIMHYAFPAWMFADKKDRIQNYVLSYLDKKFATIVYPTPDGPKSIDEGSPDADRPEVRPGANRLTINGERVAARIRPGETLSFKFQVGAGQGGGRYTIFTEGSTQVVLQLLGPSGTDMTPNAGEDHGTYDLTNDVISATLAEGEYEVRARHVSPRGGGSFTISATSRHQFSILLQPNRVRER